MTIAPKMHRPTAVFAAVLMILSQLLNIGVSLSNFSAYFSFISLTSLVSNTLITVLLVVILFRGKKDIAAGVMFLIAIFPPVFSIGFDLLSLLAGFEQILYILASVLSSFVVTVFRGIAAGECLSNGKVSAGGGRNFLWLLPILGFVCALVSHMLLGINNGMDMGETMFGGITYLVPHWLGPVLMGVSLSITANTEDP